MKTLLLEDFSSNRNHRQRLQCMRDASTGVVRISSPYVTKQNFFGDLQGRTVRLLTVADPMDVASGSTSLEALRSLVDSGVACRVLKRELRLHAKVYIFDNKNAVVSSANFTTSAFDSNIEAGVELSGAAVADLIDWFDTIWDRSEALEIPRLEQIYNDSKAFRKEFERLRRKIKRKFPPNIEQRQIEHLDLRSLQQTFAGAERFYMCNSNRRYDTRTATGGYILEQRMYEQGLAVAWGSFNYSSHMKQVKPGDVIFMFAKNVGVVGLGEATGTFSVLNAKQAERLRKATGGKDKPEWRIPVKWLAWTDEVGAFAHKETPFTFKDISRSDYSDFRSKVLKHFA